MTQDAPTKTITFELWRDDGSNIDDDEYSVWLSSCSDPLNMSAPGGMDDVSLAMDCLRNCVYEIDFPHSTRVFVTLKESGEWEDVFWHKYYVLKEVRHEAGL